MDLLHIKKFIIFIIDNGISISALLATPFTLFKYFYSRKREQNRLEFEKYHEFVENLVSKEPKMLDNQTAVIYELRNFKKYYNHSYRMLIGLKKKWLEDKERGEQIHDRLFEELNLTINFLEKRQHNRFNLIKKFIENFKLKIEN